jgi:RND family efflux transporter MFP subunit
MRLNKPVSVTIFAGLMLTACRVNPRNVEASVSAGVHAVPVTVTPVTSVEWPSTYEAVGTVRPRISTVIASKIMGYAREVRVHAGDTVSAGQLLVVIDARDLDAAWRQAQAAYDEANSAIAEADNAVASAQANLDLVKVTRRRLEDLYEKKSISEQEHDEASAKLKAAQATYEMAASRRAQLSAKIQQGQEAVAAAAAMRSYSEIRAPFAGTIIEKPVEQGTLAAPGAPLLRLEQAGAFRLEVPVEEGFLAVTRVGQPAVVKLDSFDQTITARVGEIAPSVDPASRAFIVKVDLPSVPCLRSGVYGRAQFSHGTRRAVAVPLTALTSQGQVESVMVVEEGSAHTRLVTTGQRQGDLVEILSGLNLGEQVVSPRPASLVDGASVETHP